MADNFEINPKYEKFYLDNGIKCVVYPRNEIHSIKIKVIVNVGSLDEDDSTNGLSHFIEHVVHDGTEELKTWDAIDNFTNEYSGSTNAYTSIDHTQYYGTFPSQYADKAVYFFSQIVFHPLFKESDVDKERDIILDEQKRGEDEIDYQIIRNIKGNRFESDTTPFSYDIIGKRDLLEKYSRKSLIDYYKKHYTPENTEIYIVGNVDLEKIKKALNKYFLEGIKDLEFSSKPEREFKKSFPEYSGFKINARKKQDISQYYLTLSFPTFEFQTSTEADREKENFVKNITASSQYFQSVLWKRLREELGIVYGVGSFTYDMQARSINIIQTSFDKKHLDTVLTEVYKGIESIKKNKIKDIVFKARQKRLVDTQLMKLDNPDNMINWIIDHEDEIETHGSALKLSEYLDFVRNLEFEEVIETADYLYDWSKANIGIVSKDEIDEVEEMVKEKWDLFSNGDRQLPIISAIGR